MKFKNEELKLTKPFGGCDPLKHAIKELQEFCTVISICWYDVDEANDIDAHVVFTVKDITSEEDVKIKMLDYLFYVSGSELDIETQNNPEYVCYTAYSEFLEFKGEL